MSKTDVNKICDLLDSGTKDNIDVAVSLVINTGLCKSKVFRVAFDKIANKKICEYEKESQTKFEESVNLCQLMYKPKYRDVQKQKQSNILFNEHQKYDNMINAYLTFQQKFVSEYFEYLKTQS